jgi:hypothetical protein
MRQTALLVLSKIDNNSFSFFLFYSSFHVPDSSVSEKFLTNISNSDVGKYRTNKKNTIFLTLASVNNFAKNEFEEEIFYAIFFSCLTFIIICPY